MPQYVAQIAEPARGVRRVVVQAADANAVAAALRVSPQALLEVAEAPQRRRRRSGSRIDARLFCQELALLLDSGIPMLEALETLSERDGGGSTLKSVIDALREGLPLSAALARAPENFDELLRALVAASERSGLLSRSLAQHAAYLAWARGLRSQLLAAAIYPSLLLGLGLAVLAFLLLYVLPRFAGVFDGLGDAVPAASRALIAFGAWVAAHPVETLVIAAAVPIMGVVLWRQGALREAVVAALWRSRGIGSRWRVLVLARLYRGLAVLLASGITVPASLRLLQAVVAAPLRPSVATAIAKVEAGSRLSAAMQGEGLSTAVAQRMVRVGEEAGELPLMLERAASFHDEEIARFGELIARAVNPALMLVMGGLIGAVVVLMYLPIFTLMEQVR